MQLNNIAVGNAEILNLGVAFAPRKSACAVVVENFFRVAQDTEIFSGSTFENILLTLPRSC